MLDNSLNFGHRGGWGRRLSEMPTVHRPDSLQSVRFDPQTSNGRTLHEIDMLPLAAALSAGLVVAGSETHAAGPMVTPGALATSSAESAVAIAEPAVVVVRRRAVVRRPVVRRRAVIVR